MPGFSGRNASISYDGARLTATRFTISTRADELDITTFLLVQGGNNLFQRITTGMVDAELSFDAYWDTLQSPHDAPPSIMAGRMTVNPVRVNIDERVLGGGNPRTYTFDKFICFDCTIETEVRGIVRYTVRGKGKLGFLHAGDLTTIYATFQQ